MQKFVTKFKQSESKNTLKTSYTMTKKALSQGCKDSSIPANQSMFSSVQFSLVAQSCSTLCDPMNYSSPVLPVHHQLTEFTQTHVHRVSDAIQASHPLSSPSPPAPNPSQHQHLFQFGFLFFLFLL